MGKTTSMNFKILLCVVIINWIFFTYNMFSFFFQTSSSSSSSPSSSSSLSFFPSHPFSDTSTNSLLSSKKERDKERDKKEDKEEEVARWRDLLRNNTAYNNVNNNKQHSNTNKILQRKQKKHVLKQKNQRTDAHKTKTSQDTNKTSIDASEGSEIEEEEDEQLVPNIVHYIWYAQRDKPFQFHHMLSVLSAHKFIHPSNIFFHTNHPPTGPYWQAVLQLDTFVVKERSPPRNLFGETLKPPAFYTSYSNVDRVKILIEMGGIYLDLDVIVTRSFEPLRRFPCVIGREQDTQACGSLIVCSKDSPFLLLWLNSYLDDYKDNVWAYNSGKVPFQLANRYPHLVYMDEKTVNRPNFDELDLIWGDGRFEWWKNYAVHIWYRIWRDQSPYFQGVEPNEENIKWWNCSFGQIARTVLYGSARMMDCD